MADARIHEQIETMRERLIDLAMEIWERPEVALEEHHAAELLKGMLREEEFEVEEAVADLETAFVATYGDGDPAIGVIGEFDALPGLSQRRTAEKEPVEEGAPGHGCGHNLFGVGSLGAAIAAKHAIAAGDVSGTVMYFGTPAEEILVGKPLMIQAGAFDDVDVVLSWHPGWCNSAALGSCLAMDSVHFTFAGESAHAGASPEAGRSALDAVQLLNLGVEFVREHVPDEARIHYAIDDAGAAPNVVDPIASVLYYVRAPERETVERISEWVRDVARGAALMTQTDVAAEYRGGTYEVRSNRTLAEVIERNMDELGGFDLPKADLERAEGLRNTLDGVDDAVDRLPEGYRDTAHETAMFVEPVPAFDEDEVGTYSTDVGNVSQVVPTGRCRIATWPVGTSAHSWQAVAASGSVGVHGAIYAAKVLGTAIFELLANPAIVAAAREEFEDSTDRFDFEHTVPDSPPAAQ